MIFESYITTNQEDFEQKVQSLSSTLGINPDWLMAVMWTESRINPQAVNSISGATGLIQFMESTAEFLGTSTDALFAMSNVDQLPWVYLYYKKNGLIGKMKSFFDVYLGTFWPAAIGKPDSFVFQSSDYPASLVASQNQLFDLNKDGQITMAEFKQAVLSLYPKDILSYIEDNPVKSTFTMIIAGVFIAKLFKHKS